jgi:ribosomal protein S18 acetylase RimI-like enzyme
VAVLRPARATSFDADSFAFLYQLATLNMMQGYLGPQAYRILAQIFPLPGHEHSYDLTTFAISGGVPVGLLIGCTAAAHDAVGRRTRLLYVRYGFLGLLRSLPMILTLRPLSAITGSLPPDTYYIKALAVDPDHRRKGVARMLIDEAEQKATQAGCPQILLDVRTSNTTAIAFYEACGYQTIAETPSIVHKGEVFGFLRLGKGLS